MIGAKLECVISMSPLYFLLRYFSWDNLLCQWQEIYIKLQYLYMGVSASNVTVKALIQVAPK